MDERIRLGISECLLGHNVRYDGGNKLDRFLADNLGRFLEFVPVCPEVGAGFGVPREAMRLVGTTRRTRLVTVRTKRDLTDDLLAWTRRRLKQLEKEDLSGFVLKSGSPSCGIDRVKLYGGRGGPAKTGVGLFVTALRDRFPLLPVEDETRLHDPETLKSFVERMFLYRRWKLVPRSRNGVLDFHALHRVLIQSHGPEQIGRLDRLAARAGTLTPGRLHAAYEEILAAALTTQPPGGKSRKGS